MSILNVRVLAIEIIKEQFYLRNAFKNLKTKINGYPLKYRFKISSQFVNLITNDSGSYSCTQRSPNREQPSTKQSIKNYFKMAMLFYLFHGGEY